MLKTLPGDDVRQIMWRFQHRYDLQMLIQSSRGVARGLVAHLVAEGARNSHEWTAAKQQLLKAYDEAGITTCFMDPHQGGFIEGPKNLALALVALELAWVDAGAATGSLAGNLALSPIHERGTQAQRDVYMSRCVPPQPGEQKQVWRGAFSLTEPLPYVGVETGLLSGRVSIAEWPDGQEPLLQVDKRARFITNMGFANFTTAAVESADPRLKGSCIVILEETDPGTYDRGVPTRKMVHQLSSTNDPVFSLKVPASRIIGGYTIKDGVIIPNYSHGEIIEAVFRRTRVTVGIMTAAKLLSAVEPVIRYHRNRFRGASSVNPGTPRFDQGLQQKEDCLQRLVDIWANGEAAASLGFAAARLFDELDPLEKLKDQKFAEQKIAPGMAQMKAFRAIAKQALEFIALEAQPAATRDAARYEALKADALVQYLILDSQANVLCPATKLWNTGHGANVMREAVSLVGGYGITEDCPGFLGHKWMDAQLEATYEGPEAVQRRQLSVTMTNEVFLGSCRSWIRDLQQIAATHPGIGANSVAAGMELWLWTLEHLQKGTDALGAKLFSSNRQGVTFPLADALCWLLASRQQILDVIELETKGHESATLADGLSGYVNFFTDLCAVQAATAAGEVGRICAELVYGYGSAPAGAESFVALRTKLDASLAGARLAKDRAADALTTVMIPEALDYPA
ncbi:acyl-CoA dehydrogenase domain protein [Opitutus terrae PB90-1]|uniref:Acyl-CoA dehydrogenase domain protein n=2 Tax=Opitutus terrae TaxID=107709 RepID=B1ZZ88_OPITP|nr:acyl-CoA dehydrogenase domain protein [Opitutus terrae PB90-1]